MLPTRSVALFAIALSLLSIAATTRAGTVVFNNLDQPPQPTASSPFVGQSFIAGTQDYELYGARMQLDLNNPPTTNIQLEVEARNANGTVGQTLFDNFSSSFNSGSGIVTFIANAPFLFTANTGYWLVLSDPTKGNVTWLFTASQFYESNDGYGLPSYNTSYYSNEDNGKGISTYYQPSDGPQMFQLITEVPEPSSFALLGSAAAIVVFGTCVRCNRASRFRRSPAGQAWETVRR